MTICHRESIKWFLSHCMSMYKFMYMYVYVCCTVCVKCPLLSRGVANICTSWLTFLSCITLTLTFPASITANSCTICYCMAWRVMSCHVMSWLCLILLPVMSCPTTALRSISVMPMLTISVIVQAVSAFLDLHLTLPLPVYKGS